MEIGDGAKTQTVCIQNETMLLSTMSFKLHCWINCLGLQNPVWNDTIPHVIGYIMEMESIIAEVAQYKILMLYFQEEIDWFCIKDRWQVWQLIRKTGNRRKWKNVIKIN